MLHLRYHREGQSGWSTPQFSFGQLIALKRNRFVSQDVGLSSQVIEHVYVWELFNYDKVCWFANQLTHEH